jgi:hypothetical protein
VNPVGPVDHSGWLLKEFLSRGIKTATKQADKAIVTTMPEAGIKIKHVSGI